MRHEKKNERVKRESLVVVVVVVVVWKREREGPVWCGAVRCGPAVLDFFDFMAQGCMSFPCVHFSEHNTTQHKKS